MQIWNYVFGYFFFSIKFQHDLEKPSWYIMNARKIFSHNCWDKNRFKLFYLCKFSAQQSILQDALKVETISKFNKKLYYTKNYSTFTSNPHGFFM